MASESGASPLPGANHFAARHMTGIVGISGMSRMSNIKPDTNDEPRAGAAALPELQWMASDVAAICRERGWLAMDTSPEIDAWLAAAARLLGPQSSDRGELAALLSMIFEYDASALFSRPENCALLARSGAREMLREFASLVLDGPPLDSDRFKQIVMELKDSLPWRGQRLFYPIRLALVGRAGEGALDRVILLLDSAAALPFSVPVKGTRQRMLEFCALLD
jgi:hypothetical protein